MKKNMTLMTSSTPAGEMPPSEFLVFKQGLTKSTRGDWLFTSRSAALIMSDYRKHGVDMMIDLEHLSIDEDSPAYDPSAFGWFDLEMRGGDLWAVNVRWTDEGKDRILKRKSRYISPAFNLNKKTKEVTELYNIAICAIPATHEAQALIAATKRKARVTLSKGGKMPEELKKIAAALGLGEDASLEDCLAAIEAYQEDDKEEASDDDKPDEKKSDDDKPAAKDDDKDEEKEASDDDTEEKEMAALPPKVQARIMAERASLVKLTKQVGDLTKNSRKNEVAQLIRDNADKIPLHHEKWLMSKDPDTVREYIKHSVATPRAKKEPAREPAGSDVTTLNADEIELAKAASIKPADFLAHKKKKADEKKLVG